MTTCSAETRERVLRSMWHKGRKEFTWWSGAEIEARAAASSDDRAYLVRTGMLTMERHKQTHDHSSEIYAITDNGKRMLRLIDVVADQTPPKPVRRKLTVTPPPAALRR